jgi:hypothetical protein
MPHAAGDDAKQKAEHLIKDTKQEAKRLMQDARQEAAEHNVSPWIERLARFGYATKGAVYILVGILALGVATGMGGRTTSPPGAIQIIGSQRPFGQILLIVVTIGLAGYALWRLIQAVADPDREGYDARGIARRTGHGVAALGYGGLALTAARLALASGGGGSSPQDWTAWLLSWPFGQALVVGIGTGVVGYGLHQLYQAYKAEFQEYLKLGQMSDTEETWITRGGRFGLAARGVVFGIIGVFLIQAALRFNPSEAQGLGGALQELLRQPFGPWLLGIVALGLVAYGVLMLALAYYRQVASGRVSRGSFYRG